MNRWETWKAGFIGILVLSAFTALPGCGRWNEPAKPATGSTTVSSTAPANGASVVPTGNKLAVTFSEPMDPATITDATFTLKNGTTAVTGTVSYSGVTAVFTPSTSLAASTTYSAAITTGVRAVTGHVLAADYLWSFTTGVAPDTTSPVVSSSVPANGATGVRTGNKLAVTFSEPMDPATITAATFTLKNGASAVSGTVSYSGLTAVFAPAAPLAAGTVYSATIGTGAKDLGGNALAVNFVWSFTTGALADSTKPTVISTLPAPLATGVSLGSKLAASFSEGMDPLTISTGTFAVQETVSGKNLPGTVVYSSGSFVATFTPLAGLAPSMKYSATVKGGSAGVSDLAGNSMALDKVWSFTTGTTQDNIAPSVLLVNPADLAVNVALDSSVSATFSKSMDPLTISAATFTVQASGPPLAPALAGSVSYDSNTKTANFKPAANLAASTSYTATVSTGSKDLTGNPLAANKVWSFTTGTAATPGPAAGSVALGSAGSFGIMATSAITNTGFTIINGDVSLDPGTSMTGVPPAVVNGAVHINDSVSAQARIDLLTAYNFATTLPPGTTISAGADLGALFPLGIPPGTYTSGSTMLISTPLVLDAGGNANAVWVFQIGSSLTTGANVTLANGAQAKNVFWVPALDATIGVGTVFYGTIVSGRDVTAKTGAVINGRILAGATTAGTIALDSNTVNVP